jgi:electron transfer flavoprotein beta subunit
MKIAVCLKEVLDARLPLQVEPATGNVRQINTEPILTLNPADRAALESAMQVRLVNHDTRVEAFSVSDASGNDALWYALARGVDYAERIENISQHEGAPYTAALLAKRFETSYFDLICCGDETIDNSSAVVGPLLAEILGLPQISAVVRVIGCTPNQIVAERGLERGNREVVEMDLPGLITVKAEGNEPSYISFRRLQEASNREIPIRPCAFSIGNAQIPGWPEKPLRTSPRARVKKAFVPDSKISPAERVRMIMAGGVAPSVPKSGSSSLVEGDPDYVAEQLYRFLKHHEFV